MSNDEHCSVDLKAKTLKNWETVAARWTCGTTSRRGRTDPPSPAPSDSRSVWRSRARNRYGDRDIHNKDEKKLAFLLKVGQLDLFEKRVFQLPSLVIDCREEVHWI